MRHMKLLSKIFECGQYERQGCEIRDSLFRWALTHSAMIFNVTRLSNKTKIKKKTRLSIPPAQPWRHRRALTLRLVNIDFSRPQKVCH